MHKWQRAPAVRRDLGSRPSVSKLQRVRGSSGYRSRMRMCEAGAGRHWSMWGEHRPFRCDATPLVGAGVTVHRRAAGASRPSALQHQQGSNSSCNLCSIITVAGGPTTDPAASRSISSPARREHSIQVQLSSARRHRDRWLRRHFREDSQPPCRYATGGEEQTSTAPAAPQPRSG